MNAVLPRHLALGGILEERRDDVLALREVRERPEIDVLMLVVLESRNHREAERRQRDETADDAAEPERAELEEDRAAVGRNLLSARRRRSSATSTVAVPGTGACAGSRMPRVRSYDPEEAEHDGERRPDHDAPPADHESDEQADDADREADRPEARRGDVRIVVVRAQRVRCRRPATLGWTQTVSR